MQAQKMKTALFHAAGAGEDQDPWLGQSQSGVFKTRRLEVGSPGVCYKSVKWEGFLREQKMLKGHLPRVIHHCISLSILSIRTKKPSGSPNP